MLREYGLLRLMAEALLIGSSISVWLLLIAVVLP